MDFVLKMLAWLPSLITKIKPPLNVDVLSLSFEDLGNKPGDPVVLITAWPRRYRAELTLTNRSDKVVYVKSIVLTIGHEKTRKKAESQDILRFEPHEPKEHVVIFPLNDDEEPIKAGQFQIEVTPTVGRKTVTSGCFGK